MRHSPSRSYDSRRRSSSFSDSLSDDSRLSSDDGYWPDRRTGRRWREEGSTGHRDLPSFPPRAHPSSFELQPPGGSRSMGPVEDEEAQHSAGANRNAGFSPTSSSRNNDRGETERQPQPARRPLIRHAAPRRATAGELSRRCCPCFFYHYSRLQVSHFWSYISRVSCMPLNSRLARPVGLAHRLLGDCGMISSLIQLCMHPDLSTLLSQIVGMAVGIWQWGMVARFWK